MLNSTHLEYINNNLNLTPVSNKIPLLKKWQIRNLELSELNKYENFAFVLDDTHLVVDVDRRNGGVESFKRLKVLDCTLKATVKTPNGFHVYLKKHADLKIKRTLSAYPGIDFLTKGTCVTTAGSCSEKGVYTLRTKKIEFPNASPNLLVALRNDSEHRGTTNDSLANPTHPEDIKDALAALNPSCGYHDWLTIGMALHSWDNQKGFNFWETWSRGGDNFDENACEKHWKHFKKEAGITIKTLFYKAQNIDAAIEIIENSTLENVKETASKYLEIHKNSAIAIDRIHSAITSVHKRYGQKVSKQSIQKEFQPSKIDTKFYENWAYISEIDRFCDLNTLDFYKKDGFNLINTQFVPQNDNGTRATASRFVEQNGLIEIVNSVSYLPFSNETLLDFDTKRTLNTFNYKTLPKPSKKLSARAVSAIDYIKSHTARVCGSQEYAEIFLQYIAYNVQNRGAKILWAPLIQSIEGIGKSFYYELLRCALGTANIGVVNPQQVISQFNSFATNKCVNILEELRIVGKNRHEAMNAIKPLITDKYIQINKKGVAQYNTLNTTNYICFTNYKDALPLSQDDRRWFLTCCEFQTLDALADDAKMNKNDYYNQLFDFVREIPTELAKWLYDYEITEKFTAYKQAPSTHYKELAIATSLNDIDYLSDFKELLEKGGKYFNTECFATHYLVAEAVSSVESFVTPSFKQLANIFKALNYSKYPKKISIEGNPRNVWVKRAMTIEQIKRSLNA
jgi:hypothetical protein